MERVSHYITMGFISNRKEKQNGELEKINFFKLLFPN